MRSTRSLISAGLFGAATVLCAGTALAQTSDGSDYRPMQVANTSRPEVQQGAIAAAQAHNGGGSESIGSSTAPRMTDGSGGDAAHQGALAFAHAHNGAGSESIGSSTAPMPVHSGS